MAKLVFSMNLSLDGYVDHEGFAPDPVLFRHWTRQVRGATASICGRRIYQIMRYWEEDRPGWTPAEHEFAAAWRKQPKWVVSRSLASVGPDATLLSDDIGAVVRDLKARMQGRIDIIARARQPPRDRRATQRPGRVEGRAGPALFGDRGPRRWRRLH